MSQVRRWNRRVGRRRPRSWRGAPERQWAQGPWRWIPPQRRSPAARQVAGDEDAPQTGLYGDPVQRRRDRRPLGDVAWGGGRHVDQVDAQRLDDPLPQPSGHVRHPRDPGGPCEPAALRGPPPGPAARAIPRAAGGGVFRSIEQAGGADRCVAVGDVTARIQRERAVVDPASHHGDRVGGAGLPVAPVVEDERAGDLGFAADPLVGEGRDLPSVGIGGVGRGDERASCGRCRRKVRRQGR